MHVYAIDNGPMKGDLMATGMVEHLREDGFGLGAPLSVGLAGFATSSTSRPGHCHGSTLADSALVPGRRSSISSYR